jgi:hypothetical protein
MSTRNLLCLLVAIAGCGKADPGGTDGPAMIVDMSSPSTGGASIVGSWLSAGGNLAKGFTTPPFSYKSISGIFNADATYSVVGTDSSGKMTTLAGTWMASPSSVAGIYDFVQSQTQPSAATAKGIFQLDATVTPNLLTLEGVQTSPSLGANPPTAQAGFGSTTVNGTKTSDWIQKYERQ